MTTKKPEKKILLHAYGNPGRGDDGLGNEFVKAIEQWIAETGFVSVVTESSYQLNIEDASNIADFDIVIFIDASKAEMESFTYTRLQPQLTQTFSTHSISPPAVLALCQELYNRSPLVYLLQIKGYHWEFGEGLSANALKNLQKAIIFVKSAIADFHKQE